jgi:hypothetical protein
MLPAMSLEEMPMTCATVAGDSFLHITGPCYISPDRATKCSWHASAHNTRMPPAGERPDDFSLAADAQNSAVFGEQHRVTRGLAELNDGLQ